MSNDAFGQAVALKFDDAVAKVTQELAKEGSGVLTEVDVAATIKKKIGVGTPPYKILGACSPQFVHRSLSAEPQINAHMPCNVMVRDDANGKTQVEFMDPIAAMDLVGKLELRPLAAEVCERLEKGLRGDEHAGGDLAQPRSRS